MIKNSLIFFLLCIASVLSAKEYTVGTVPNPRTADAANYVCNPDGILHANTTTQINEILQSLESSTKAEIAVVALKSIGNEDIVDFGVALFKEWGIGKKGLDNGLLILLVEEQRSVRFEVGYGLEGVLPDAICKRIQTQAMLPEFKLGDYDAGILAGIKSLAGIVANNDETADKSLIANNKPSNLLWLKIYATAIILALFYAFWDASKIKRNQNLKTNKDRYFAMKKKTVALAATIFIISLLAAFIIAFLANEFTSFSPASPFLTALTSLTMIPAVFFGYIRAKIFRRQKILCNICNNEMKMQNELDDDFYLTASQCFEELIKSVDYDVLLCGNCQNTVIYDYEKQLYERCPKCNTKAYGFLKEEVLRYPSTFNSGEAQEIHSCRFCQHTNIKTKTLPRISALPSTVSGRGFSGGGFGGGSRGGSFGGGRSGGGGAMSRW